MPLADVRLNGGDLQSLDVSDRVEAGLALVPEDRQAAGLVPSMTVCENMTLSSLARLAPQRVHLAGRRSRSAASRCSTSCASRHPHCTRR